jgi:RNA polymerase sigma-70 factor, ECF subfamily
VAGGRDDRGEPVDAELIAALGRGDDEAFAQLVRDWSPMMLGVARRFVATRESAEEVVQEAWLTVITGLGRFEGRSSLRTWVIGTVCNIGRRQGAKEARTVPVGALHDDDGPTVSPARFRGPGDPYPGHWTEAGHPRDWGPEQQVLDAEAHRRLAAALEQLPERQRTVVSLRDVHGLTSEEVSQALEVSAGNQRVLLHRGRARLRQILEDYYTRTDR